MTSIPFNIDELQNLNGKTLLITGTASGIGRETAKIAYENGANLALADWNDEGTLDLIEQLGATLGNRIVFRKTDVANFDDILEIFQLAWKTFGVIDAVISNAGVNTGENLFEDQIDPKLGKLLAPSLQSININLIGHVYIVKCAEHYFRKWPERRCQIVLTGSAASFLDTPPLYMYCTAKAGVLGLMRGIRTQLIKRNITINMVAPWLTITPMLLPSLLPIWKDLPANQPASVAYGLLLPILHSDMNGKSLFIAGNEIIEFEDKLHETQSLWMGKRLSEDVDEGQRRLIP